MNIYILYTAHKFPFSLFSESKRGARECTVLRTGDVTDQMDRGIGRPVIKIKGIVSANNSIEISNLNLTGDIHILFLIYVRNSSIKQRHKEL